MHSPDKKITLALGPKLCCSSAGLHRDLYAPILWPEKGSGATWDHHSSLFRLSQEAFRDLVYPEHWPFTQPIGTQELWTFICQEQNFVHTYPWHCFRFSEYFRTISWEEAVEELNSGQLDVAVVPIRFADTGFLFDLLGKSIELPEQVLKLIRTRKAVLLFECSTEGNFLSREEIDCLDKWITLNRLPKKFVYFLGTCTGGTILRYLNSRNRRFIYRTTQYFLEEIWGEELKCTTDFQENENWEELEKYIDKANKLPILKKFLVLGGAIRPVRIYLYCAINADSELRESCITSIKNSYGCWNVLRDPNCYDRKFVKSIDPKLDDVIADLVEKHTEDATEILYEGDTGNIYGVTKQKIRDDSFIEVVSETNFEDPLITFTEKTFKPMLSKKPFILVGSPGRLECLHRMGFKSFEEFWDESYDTVLDSRERAKSIFNLLKELDKKSLEELEVLREEMKPILDHNFNRLKELSTVLPQESIQFYQNLVTPVKLL